MEESNNTGRENETPEVNAPDPQVLQRRAARSAVLEAFIKVAKHISEGSSAAAVVAGINILLGAAVLLIFDMAPDTLGAFAADPYSGLGFIIFGLIYLVLAVGIYKRSRICAFLAMAAFAADSIFMFVSGDFADLLNAGTILMRVAIFLAFFHGLRYCLKFRKLVRENEDEYAEDSDICNMIQTKPKMKASRIVIYALFAIIGIGAGAWGFVGTGAGGNFEDWTEYTTGSITVMIPNERVITEEEVIPDLPGVRLITVESTTRPAEVLVMRSQGFEAMNLPASVMEDMAELMMLGGVEAVTDDFTMSSGTMLGLPFQRVTGMYRTNRPVEFRAMIINGEIYIVAAVVSREDNIDLIEQFFDSIEIR